MKASGYDPVIRNKFPRPVNPIAVGVDWGARGYRCRRMVDPPGGGQRAFEGGANKLIIVLKGRLEIVIAGQRIEAPQPIEADEGDEIFIPAGAAHTIRNAGPTAARWLCGYQA